MRYRTLKNRDYELKSDFKDTWCDGPRKKMNANKNWEKKLISE